MRPRRSAWVFGLFAAVLFFLAIVRLAWTVTGLPDWLEDAGLCSLAIAVVAWAFPNQPPTVP